jgi:hypothetical protein
MGSPKELYESDGVVADMVKGSGEAVELIKAFER